jgi:hypothetical protein
LAYLGFICSSQKKKTHALNKTTESMPSKSGTGGSGSGSKDKGIRIGDYVKESTGKKRRGRVVGADGETAMMVDFGDKVAVSTPTKDLVVTRNTMGGAQFKEILLNSALFASIQGVRKSDTFMGNRSVSFLISDALYEFLLKGFAEKTLPMLRPDSITEKDAREKFFNTADLKNGVGKAVPLVVLMQLYGMAVHKAKFSQHIGKNILDAAIACSASNIIDRKFFADKDKTYSY